MKNMLGIVHECKTSAVTIIQMEGFMGKEWLSVSKSWILIAYHVYPYNDLIVPK
jgi:hypothetical protein